jgi:hypothetical protein
MLNGLDPILIFQFKKLLPDLLDLGTTKPKIPVVASEGVSTFPLPFIPIYLSEKLTGLYIDTENKSIEIDSQAETLSNGDAENINQRGISSTVKIEMLAVRDSIGISLLSALTDLVFPKVTSKEYSITYLHGAVTVFNGYLHSFSIDQNSTNDLYKVSLELIKPSALKLPIPIVGKVLGTTLGAR